MGEKLYRVRMDSKGMPDFSTALEVVDIPQGEWVCIHEDIYCCSNCGEEAPLDEWEYKYRDKIRANLTPYCPNCGRRMKGVGDE